MLLPRRVVSTGPCGRLLPAWWLAVAWVAYMGGSLRFDFCRTRHDEPVLGKFLLWFWKMSVSVLLYSWRKVTCLLLTGCPLVESLLSFSIGWVVSPCGTGVGFDSTVLGCLYEILVEWGFSYIGLDMGMPRIIAVFLTMFASVFCQRLCQ